MADLNRPSSRLTPVTDDPEHSDKDAPRARAPEREPSLGSKVFAAARPVLGADRADDLATLARLFDATPELARVMTRVFGSDPSATQTDMRLHVANHPPNPEPRQPRKATRPAVVVLAAVSFALVLGGTMGLFWELRDLRAQTLDADRRSLERTSTLEARVARAEGEASTGAAASAAEKRRVDALELESKDQRDTLAVLTEHMISRLDAIGEKTGADKLDVWTAVPDDLSLVVAQKRKRDRDDARRGGG